MYVPPTRLEVHEDCEVSESCVNAKEVAALLKVSPRSLDARHNWSPAFPRPIMKRPLIWRLADVEDWIRRASRERNAA
jgi:predicted DNA-binding transcriptional regulator AlpA